MPKNRIKKKHVNRKVFDYILKVKGFSLRKLGCVDEKRISCTERTLRRELKNGELREKYLEEIGKILDVDPRLLSGELVKEAFDEQDELRSKHYLYLYPLHHLDEYPFSRAEQDRLQNENIDEILKRILSLFEISFDQYQAKNFDEQYNFQHDLISSMLPVMYKHFDKDRFGDTERYSFESILAQLENYKDNHDEKLYADTKLREKFLKNPPKGYSRKKIEKMSPQEIIDLDIELQYQEDEKYFGKITLELPPL